jgi:predicted DNA-binding transcriptional regulator AlpA
MGRVGSVEGSTMEMETNDLPLRVIPPRETASRAGVSVRTLQRMVREGRAVTPVKVSDARIGFYEHEVQAWLASLPRTREVA